MTEEERTELTNFKNSMWSAVDGIRKDVQAMGKSLVALTCGLDANTKAIEAISNGRSPACIEENSKIEHAQETANRALAAVEDHKKDHDDSRKMIIKWLLYGAIGAMILQRAGEAVLSMFK